MFNKKWELLLLKTPHWTLDMPGGWLDHGETIEDWLRREIQEETWCECTIQWPICTRTRLHKNWVYYFFIWIACNINLDNFIPSDEAESYHFFSKKGLLKDNEHANRLEYIKENYENICKEYVKKNI
jgi:8-oxo-dGTP pyrophosphatase MutT (NUDIX family)